MIHSYPCARGHAAVSTAFATSVPVGQALEKLGKTGNK